MKSFRLFLLSIIFLSFFASLSYSQWECKYITQDDSPNGTGYNTPSVAVFGEDLFVALVSPRKAGSYDSLRSCYLVGYRNAGNITGRLGTYPYAKDNLFWKWGTGSDTVRMWNAFKIVASPKNNLVFVANNDADHSILTFEFKQDTVVPAPYRMKTGSRNIWGIDVDDNGRVYVVMDSTTKDVQADVMIFESVDKEPKWRTTHDATPLKTLDLPASLYKGLAVDGSGKYLFIADYQNKKVIKFQGGPTTGYSQVTGFDFKLTIKDTITNSIPRIIACPIGLSYMRPFNILAVACDTFLRRTTGYAAIYPYGRIYLVDPMSGKLAGQVVGDDSVSVIDQAKWNFSKTGSYSSAQDPIVSGYASTYDVGYDAIGNVYSQSYYGWTVEKWSYFPVIPALTFVKKLDDSPSDFDLKQNYPNPFNPTTNIEFSIPKSSFVSIKIYNVLGQEISSLLNEFKTAGSYKVAFNANKLSSGTYFYGIQAGDYSAKKKMILMK